MGAHSINDGNPKQWNVWEVVIGNDEKEATINIAARTLHGAISKAVKFKKNKKIEKYEILSVKCIVKVDY